MSEFLDKTGLSYFWGKLKALLAGKANGNSAGTALKTEGIPFGEVDSTSTATAFTATVTGITELKDGTVVMLRNGVVTSASGFTININGLGAKPVYSNLATGNDVTPTNPTRDTTIFNINYTMLFVYQSDLVSGGAWICYRGYDANTNTIGYQLRTNSGSLAASDTGYRYRLWLTSADGTKFVPINTSTSTNATTARTLNTRKIDPFGAIVYNGTNGTVNAGARPAVATLWQQYTLTIGYSYVLSMTAWKPVYLKCTPQTDGSAVMDTLTQTLPSTNDGYIYIFLGIAYSATAMELNVNHPVYYHDGTGIRLWSGAASGGGAVDSVNGQTGTVVLDATDVGALPDTTVIPSASSTTPAMDGTAAVGTSTNYARADHVHPTDTSRQATLVSGTNIKTVNNESLLGSGNINISGGGTRAWCGASPTLPSNNIKYVIIQGFEFVEGTVLTVFFDYGQYEARSLTLNATGDINQSGISIKRNGELVSASNPLLWGPQSTLTFIYSNGYFDYSASGQIYELPMATTTTLGGVKVDGLTVSIDSNGVISAQGGSSGGGADLVIRCNSSSERGLSNNASDYEVVSGSVAGFLAKAFTNGDAADALLYAFGGDHIEEEYSYQVLHFSNLDANSNYDPSSVYMRFSSGTLSSTTKWMFTEVSLGFETDYEGGYNIAWVSYSDKYCTLTNS